VLLLHAGKQLALESPAALLPRLPARTRIDLAFVPGSWPAQMAELPGVTASFTNGHTATLY
jgi:hypothetical protein